MQAIKQRAGRTLMPVESAGTGSKKERRAVNVQQLFEEYEQTDAERQTLVSVLEEAYAYTQPERNSLLSDPQALGKNRQGQDGQRKDYASEPMDAVSRGASNILSALMPPERRWVKLEAGADIPEDQADRVNESLEEWTEVLFNYLSRSNVSSEGHRMVLDLMIGTGAMVVEEGDEDSPLRFTAVPSVQVRPILGADNSVEKVHRRYLMKVSHIRQKWPLATLSGRLATLALTNPAERVEIHECTIQGGSGEWRFLLIDPDTKGVMLDQPLDRKRWVVPRWEVRTGQTYGIGPVRTALPAIRNLNKLDELELLGLAKAVDPPLLMDSAAVLNPRTFRVSPNAINVIDAGGAPVSNAVQPLLSASNPGLLDTRRDRLIRTIERICLAQEFLPPPTAAGSMTAAEVMVRRQEALRDAGVNIGRLQREFLYSIVEIAVDILADAGLFPPIKVDGKQVRVRYVGPLSQQQDADDATNVSTWAQEAQAAVGPQAFMLAAKVEEIPKKLGEMRGIPMDLLRSDQEVQQMQQAAAQAATAGAEMPEA